MPNKNITWDSLGNEASPPSMCRAAASGLLMGCVWWLGRLLAGIEEVTSMCLWKGEAEQGARGGGTRHGKMALATASTNLTRIHSTCILPLEA